MNFNMYARTFAKPQRITFSCDLNTVKLMKKHIHKFKNCQSDLIKKAVVEYCLQLEKEEHEREIQLQSETDDNKKDSSEESK